jgi:hypothetical protein
MHVTIRNGAWQAEANRQTVFLSLPSPLSLSPTLSKLGIKLRAIQNIYHGQCSLPIDCSRLKNRGETGWLKYKTDVCTWLGTKEEFT